MQHYRLKNIPILHYKIFGILFVNEQMLIFINNLLRRKIKLPYIVGNYRGKEKGEGEEGENEGKRRGGEK